MLLHLGNYKYFGALLGGLLFISTFTLPTGAIILLGLAKILPPIPLIIIAGLGAVTGDLLIFKFVQKDVTDEITPIYENLINHSHFKKILHTKYFSWTLPVLGTLILASPLPDELGISLMGLSQITTMKFILVSIASHALGISLLVGILG